MHSTYVRGSVLLWWHCDTLCTSGLGTTSYLHKKGHMQRCRCNTGTASQPDGAARRLGRAWAAAEASSRNLTIYVTANRGRSLRSAVFIRSNALQSFRPHRLFTVQSIRCGLLSPMLYGRVGEALIFSCATESVMQDSATDARPTVTFPATRELILHREFAGVAGCMHAVALSFHADSILAGSCIRRRFVKKCNMSPANGQPSQS